MNVVLDLIGFIMHPLIGQILVDCNDTDLQEASIISSWRAARRNLRGSFASNSQDSKKVLRTKHNVWNCGSNGNPILEPGYPSFVVRSLTNQKPVCGHVIHFKQ